MFSPGECWGSMRGHLDYAKHGESNNCVHDGSREAWGKCKNGKDVACSGEALTNFVYKVAPTGTSIHSFSV